MTSFPSILLKINMFTSLTLVNKHFQLEPSFPVKFASTPISRTDESGAGLLHRRVVAGQLITQILSPFLHLYVMHKTV
jgi:hypothetical protein